MLHFPDAVQAIAQPRVYGGQSADLAALPPTAEQMGVQVPDGGCPLIVISEGRVIEKNLKALGHDAKWLHEELERRKKREAKEIYLMTVNRAGQSYIAEKEAGA